MSTTFSAKEPALGYYYQIIRGLVLLLDEDRMESPSLSFECLDDISIENEEGNETVTNCHQLKLPAAVICPMSGRRIIKW